MVCRCLYTLFYQDPNKFSASSTKNIYSSLLKYIHPNQCSHSSSMLASTCLKRALAELLGNSDSNQPPHSCFEVSRAKDFITSFVNFNPETLQPSARGLKNLQPFLRKTFHANDSSIIVNHDDPDDHDFTDMVFPQESVSSPEIIIQDDALQVLSTPRSSIASDSSSSSAGQLLDYSAKASTTLSDHQNSHGLPTNQVKQPAVPPPSSSRGGPSASLSSDNVGNCGCGDSSILENHPSTTPSVGGVLADDTNINGHDDKDDNHDHKHQHFKRDMILSHQRRKVKGKNIMRFRVQYACTQDFHACQLPPASIDQFQILERPDLIRQYLIEVGKRNTKSFNSLLKNVPDLIKLAICNDD